MLFFIIDSEPDVREVAVTLPVAEQALQQGRVWSHVHMHLKTIDMLPRTTSGSSSNRNTMYSHDVASQAIYSVRAYFERANWLAPTIG